MRAWSKCSYMNDAFSLSANNCTKMVTDVTQYNADYWQLQKEIVCLFVANIFSLKDVSVHEQSLLTGIQGLANWTLLWTMETMETQTIDNQF